MNVLVTPPSSSSPSSAAMQEIVGWSAQLPAWQRDALRRLSLHGRLTEKDYLELLAMCRAAHEGAGASPSTPKPQPLTAQHVKADTTGKVVALKRIKDVCHVNALADGQSLTFRDTGLTIVYGGNGSGKSGYTRILKKACRARAAGEAILPNVYDPQATSGASATIEYTINSVAGPAPAHWVDGAPTADELTAISVFDSACAVTHVEKANDVAYTPAALDMLEQLAEVCRELKRRLKAEEKQLQLAVPAALVKPQCQAGTKVSKLLTTLSATTDMAGVQGLATLTPDEQRRQATLRADLSKDLGKQIEQLRQRKAHLLRVITTVRDLTAGTSDTVADNIKQLLVNAEIQAEAARVAAEELFRDEPLPHVGSETWRALWESARAYSTREEYPTQEFPVTTGDGAYCVLCQQALTLEAAQRLTRFNAFVQANAQVRAIEAARACEAALTALRALQLTKSDRLNALGLINGDLESPAVAVELRRFLTLTRWRRRLLLGAKRTSEWPSLPPVVPTPIAELEALVTSLDTRIADLHQAMQDETRQALVKELQELDDRVWLGHVLDDVRADIMRRKKLAILTKAIADTETRGITSKSTELADRLVTATLTARFTEEVQSFGIERLQAEMQQSSSEYGVPKFRIGLTGQKSPDVRAIFSEGEHRCIALAAFLSELATADDHSGIVFDDPVSSLDHEYRQAVAKRLVQEAQVRQVIVFTHDIVFLTQLSDEARRCGIDPHYQCIGRGEDQCGYCHAEIPMNVRPVLDALDSLDRHLTNVTHAYTHGNTAKWLRETKGIAEELRELWERAVEEKALSPVYTRYAYKVKTAGLIKVTVLTAADCVAMREAFRRMSKLLHSGPLPAGITPPQPEDVRHEIITLREWILDIVRRQEGAVLP